MLKAGGWRGKPTNGEVTTSVTVAPMGSNRRRGQRWGKASRGTFAIGFLLLLTGIRSDGIGRQPSSHLDHPDDGNPKVRVGFSYGGESHRELENDGNETAQETASSMNATANANANANANETTQKTTIMNAIRMSKAIFVAIVALGSMAMLLSIVSSVFVYVYRNNSLVAIGQPPFLYLICFGSFLLSSELFFLFRYESSTGIDVSEESLHLDATCLVELWLRNVGSVCVHMAIFCKMWRANKVFRFRKNLRIMPKHVIGPFAVTMLTMVALTIYQTVTDDSEWYVLNLRMPASNGNDASSTSGQTVTSLNVGACMSPGFHPAVLVTGGDDEGFHSSHSAYAWIDLATFLVVILSLVLMLYMAWLTRTIPEEISDSRRVFQAVVTGLCLQAVTFALLCAGMHYKIHELSILAKSLNFFSAATIYVGFLIVPKLYSIWQKRQSSEESDFELRAVSTDRTTIGTRRRVYISGLNPSSQSKH